MTAIYHKKPLAIDLYAGLGGWTEGLLAEGFRVVGFDIERHVYGEAQYPAQLVIQDVLTLHGSQFRDAALIVASPPCQFFSYVAMPWSRAKQLAAAVRADPERIKKETALFGACFRIQREAIEAAGHHIPLVVENVRGAQKWVGRSRWNFGSFHLWGDVPALMPIPRRTMVGEGVKAGDRNKGRANGGHKWDTGFDATLEGLKNPGFRFDGSGRSMQTESVGRHIKPGRRTDVGNGARFTSRDCGVEGIKQRGSGRKWFAGEGKISRVTSSKSPARKAASAHIAKIPLVLSRHIAAAWHPQEVKLSTEPR